MKKTAVLLITMLLAFVSISENVNAANPGATFTNSEKKYYYMEATAYCIHGRTATGTYTRKGICAAAPEHFGQVAMVYKDNNGLPGEFIGYYECQDTGGESIRSGKVIDIWFPSYQEAIKFGRKKILVVWVDGVG